MRIFDFEIELNEEEKKSKCIVYLDEEHFDKEALPLIKSLILDVGKLITIAYLQKAVEFNLHLEEKTGGEA